MELLEPGAVITEVDTGIKLLAQSQKESGIKAFRAVIDSCKLSAAALGTAEQIINAFDNVATTAGFTTFKTLQEAHIQEQYEGDDVFSDKVTLMAALTNMKTALLGSIHAKKGIKGEALTH